MPPRPLSQILLQEKPCLVLLSVVDNPRLIVSDVMRHAETTFSHATNLIAELESRGLLTTSTEGRAKYVQATPLGVKIAKSIRAVNNAGNPNSVNAEVDKISRRARQLLDDLESREREGGDTSHLKKRFRRLEDAMASLECQLLAAGARGKKTGMKELRATVVTLRKRIETS